MVFVQKRTCEEEDCKKRNSYGFADVRLKRFCAEHKLPGMINLSKALCEVKECNKIPSFNVPGENKGRFCFTHKLDGMVNYTRRPKCEDKYCDRNAVYNIPDIRVPRFCSSHKTEEMIHIYRKRCAFDSCLKEPSFNFPSEKSTKFCYLHQEEGMINLRSRSCELCDTTPRFNYPGEPRATHCSNHKCEGMVSRYNKNPELQKPRSNPQPITKKKRKKKKVKDPTEIDQVRSVKGTAPVDPNPNEEASRGGESKSSETSESFAVCEDPNCGKKARFNIQGNNQGRFCLKHKLHGMVNVSRPVYFEIPELPSNLWFIHSTALKNAEANVLEQEKDDGDVNQITVVSIDV